MSKTTFRTSWILFNIISILILILVQNVVEDNCAYIESTVSIDFSYVGTTPKPPEWRYVLDRNPAACPPIDTPTSTIIFLHGLAGKGFLWGDIIHALQQPHTKILIPLSKKNIPDDDQELLIDWFEHCQANNATDDRNITQTTEYVHKLIDLEIKKGIPSERIILAGFSIGGSIALNAALTCRKKLGGVMVANTLLAQVEAFKQKISIANKKIPILLVNGEQDRVIPKERAAICSDVLKAISPNVQYKMYHGLTHELIQTQLKDMAEFSKKYAGPIPLKNRFYNFFFGKKPGKSAEIV